jgi:hypothetical protein
MEQLNYNFNAAENQNTYTMQCQKGPEVISDIISVSPNITFIHIIHGDKELKISPILD